MATLDLTSYNISNASTARRESTIILDQADDRTVRLADYGGTDKWRLQIVIDGLSDTERDTLTDAVEGNDNDLIRVDMGTRNYDGYLRPGSLQWGGNNGLFRVRFTLVAAEVV